MKLTALVSAAALALALTAGGAFAQATAPAPAAAPAAAPAMHSAKSVECSKEADAKGLHGKERKKFRAECKKAK